MPRVAAGFVRDAILRQKRPRRYDEDEISGWVAARLLVEGWEMRMVGVGLGDKGTLSRGPLV